MEKIKKQILKKIKPAPDEDREMFDFSEKLKEVANSYLAGYGAEAIICGSTGKGTHLRGDYDIDLFITFPKSESLEGKLEIFKQVVKDMGGEYEISYAEHPYLKAKIGKFSIDMVPCYRIKPGEKIISAVDRSPLHLEFVLNNLTDEMKDDVRLLKHFLKSNDVYGSDVKNESISGYVLEVMVYHLKTFENVVKFLSEMKFGDTLGNPKKKFNDPLVVADPVDSGRNTAAAMSVKSFMLIKRIAGHFIRTKKWVMPRRKFKKRNTDIFVIEFSRPDEVDDTLYPQARKLAKHITKYFERSGITTYGWEVDVGRHVKILIEAQKFAEVMKIIGPPVRSRENCRKFLEKHENCWVEDARIVCRERRGEKSWKELVKSALADAGESKINLKSFRIVGPDETILDKYSVLE